tara:strand:- start:106 stop:909 length:804 start_codon:yes stop_codon:yes gene_type:complete
MNLGTLVGLVLGIGLIGYSMFAAAAQAGLGMGAYVDIPSFLIVFGGALSAVCIAYKLSDVLSILKSMGRLFKDDNFTLGDVVDDAVELATANRSGQLESQIDGTPSSMPFRMHMIKSGIQMIVDGSKLEDIEEILINQEKFRYVREDINMGVMKKLGEYTPAFGMVGTLIGLVMMLYGMGAGESENMAAQLGLSMAVALITTLYGALFANFLFLPFADKLDSKNKIKKIESALCTEAIILIAKKVHPITVRERLNAFIPRKQRKVEE